MSQQLHNFFTEVLRMPHFGNDHAGSGVKVNSHEEALKVRLIKCGFTQEFLVKSLRPKVVKRALNSADDQAALRALVPNIKPGTFIFQPCSGQHFPDFIVCDFSGWIFVLEAKSTTSLSAHKPVWNGALPMQKAIYVFSNEEYNQTTIFQGCDVITPEDEEYLIEEARLRKTLKIKGDKFKRGWGLYNRAKYDQWGGDVMTNYFNHSDRQRCEQNVLSFALNA